MKNRTITVSLSADREPVFAYLAELENLPRWAPGVCRGLRAEGAYWRATSPAGEDYFALVADERTGVIDVLIGEQPDEMALLPLRVVGRPHGCAVIGTVFQSANCADEIYERCYAAVLGGLRGLVDRFDGGEVVSPTCVGQSFYPSLVTGKFYETWDFYTAQLGFRTVCESDVYVHLVHPSGAQLGVLREELDGLRAEFVTGTDGRGFWINLDVADADAEHGRLCAAGVEVVEPLENKPWGDRQFLVRDPNGVLIAIAHRLVPRVEQLEAAVAR